MDQCQASDSPGELLRLAVIEGHRYGPLQPMRYDDDDDDDDVVTFVVDAATTGPQDRTNHVQSQDHVDSSIPE